MRQREDRIRELERELGRKTMEAKIMREVLDKSRSRKPTLLAGSLKTDRSRVKAVSETLRGSRVDLHDRVTGKTKTRWRGHTGQDAAMSPLIEWRVATRPTHGCRCITAAPNRTLRGGGLAPVNQKRVCRIMKFDTLLPVRALRAC